MNILDENIPVIQCTALKNRHMAARHWGYDMGRKGMKDEAIIPFLLTLPRPIAAHRTDHASVLLIGDTATPMQQF